MLITGWCVQPTDGERQSQTETEKQVYTITVHTYSLCKSNQMSDDTFTVLMKPSTGGGDHTHAKHTAQQTKCWASIHK